LKRIEEHNAYLAHRRREADAAINERTVVLFEDPAEVEILATPSVVHHILVFRSGEGIVVSRKRGAKYPNIIRKLKEGEW
jgi:hypothetical protein